jgi:hypothetical protein
MKAIATKYPIVRRSFGSAEEIGDLLNRSPSYVSIRLNGHKPFTEREKRKIAEYLRRPEDISLLFEEGELSNE